MSSTASLSRSRELLPGETDAEFRRIVDELTRRGLIAGGLGTVAALTLAACSADGEPSGSDRSGAWSFTDDLGRTVHLPKRPSRIASTDDLVSVALLKAGVRVCASPLLPGGLFPALDLPTNGVTAIANAANEFNVERTAASRPELIVDFIQEGKPAVTSATPKLKDLAPVVSLQVNDASVQQIIESARRFAGAVRGLRRAADAPDAAAKRDFSRAVATLHEVASSKPGIRVAFVLPIARQLNVSRLKNTPYMQTLENAGVSFIADGGAAGDYFHGISWEQALTLPVDVLVPVVPVTDPSPVWSRMPAVAAGQVFTANPTRWSGYFYENYSSLLTDFSAFLHGAEVVAPH